MATTFTHGRGDVTVTNQGAAFASSRVGLDHSLVLVGEGYVGPNDATSGDPNTLYDIGSPLNASVEAQQYFGQSPLTTAIVEALRQDQVPAELSALSPSTEAVTGEDPSGNGDVLLNYPIIEDLARITAYDGSTTPSEITATFAYEQPPSAPASGDDATVAINPLTGQVAGLPSGGTIDYEYLDWQTALSSQDLLESIGIDETGFIVPLVDSETVGLQLSQALDTMRERYRLAQGVIGTEPNLTDADGRPVVDADSSSGTAYTDQMDRPALYAAGPARLQADDALSRLQANEPYFGYRTALPGLGGRFAGNDITDPTYNDELAGYGALEQNVAYGGGRDYLESVQTIPLIDKRSGRPGARTRNVQIKGNHSTSTATTYPQTLQVQSVLDKWTATIHKEGEYLLGRLAVEEFLEQVATNIRRTWRDFVAQGLFRETTGGVAAGGSGDGQQNTDPTQPGSEEESEAFFVELKALPDGTIDIATGVAPTPVTTTVRATTNVGTPGTVSEAASGGTLVTAGQR